MSTTPMRACTAHLPRSMTTGFFLGDEREPDMRMDAAIPLLQRGGTFLPSSTRLDKGGGENVSRCTEAFLCHRVLPKGISVSAVTLFVFGKR